MSTKRLSIQPGMSPDMLRLITELQPIVNELDRRTPKVVPSVFSNDAKRPQATKNAGRIIFVKQADKSVRGQYSDGTAWRTLPLTTLPSVTGSRGGNAALASLLTALAAQGLIVDNTSP